MFAKGLHPGATWHKCDFQIHTPRDAQWKGSPALSGGTEEAEAAREHWADVFVDACLHRGLSAIAITDHHDFCLVGYVQRAILRRGAATSLWLYPGAEVTCNDSVQCLLLFDVGTETAALNRVFGGHLQNIEQVPHNSAQAPQTELSGKDIAKFIEDVEADNTLSVRTIILPNATDGGHKTILRQGFHVRFRDLPFDGVYVDGAFDAVGDVAKRKIYGQIEQWGKRRRGIVPTGDNRHADWRNLGVHPCWIRLGEPTTEAIRQAVLADQARIAYRQPSPPAQRVLGLAVSSTLLGPDFSLALNDGFNALIGGRGSGKSAILEYLRFGLGRAAADIVSGAEDVRSRENDLIETTLQDGHVEVTLVRDGIQEVWRRDLAMRNSIVVTVTDGTPETITIGAAQERFRARGFYQKQLSTLVSDERSAAEQITGIAAAESVDELRVAERDVEAAKRQVQRFVSQMEEYWISEATVERDRANVIDIKRRLDAVRKRIEASGIGKETQQILDEAPIYASTEALIDEASRDIEGFTNKFREIRTTPPVDVESLQKVAPNFPEMTAFLKEAAEAYKSMQAALDTALDAMLRLDGAQQILAKDFAHRRAAFDKKHAEALRQQADVGSLVTELQTLNTDLQNAETAERRSAASYKILETIPKEFAEARTMLEAKVSEQKVILGRAADKVRAMSTILEAQVQTENRPAQYVSALLALSEATRIRDPEGKCEAAVERLPKDAIQSSWTALANSFLNVFRQKVKLLRPSALEVTDGAPEAIQSAFGELTTQQLSAVFSNINRSSIAALTTATVGAFIGFSYRDSSGLMPFKQASPGQQAAALLHLLLHQQAGTLIIDQPEDDLDNRTIMGIVDLLQTTKQQRQLIFATHNPNFVVNGDADKIVALMPDASTAAAAQKRISIDTDGAIETTTVRNAITEIMEGGEAAFELRSRKYQFI